MNILSIDFPELYERHLCRHSQFGINVGHILAVIGVYYSMCGLIELATGSMVVLGACIVIYLTILATNVPLRVFLACFTFTTLLVAAFAFLPRLDLGGWEALVYVVVILFFHKFQVWSHRVYTKARDMSKFTAKYRKGLVLFVLLAVYELPILLNYLVFDSKNWES